MSDFKDFQSLENPEKNLKTFKDLHGPARALGASQITIYSEIDLICHKLDSVQNTVNNQSNKLLTA